MNTCPKCGADSLGLRGFRCGTNKTATNESAACLRRQLAAVQAERDEYLEELHRQHDRIEYFERSRYCHSPQAKRPVLYTDTVGGEQCCVDNLWAVTTQELNELEADNSRLREALENVLDELTAPGKPSLGGPPVIIPRGRRSLEQNDGGSRHRPCRP